MNNADITVKHIDITEKQVKQTYFKSMISFSHITGSVTSLLVNYVRSVFNDSYIKTIFNTAEVPFAQRNKQSLTEIINKPKPMLIIEPKFNLSDMPNFRPQTEFDSWISNSPTDQIKMSLRTASPLLKLNNYALYFNPRRYKMEFNLSFVFDSKHQMLQCLEYFRQSVRHNVQSTGYKYLENLIPNDYMKAIAKITGYDYASEKFIKYLNIHSTAPIERRMRTGSGNDEFFATQRTPVELTFTEGPVANDPVKKGNIEVSASFSENVTFEFTAYSTIVLVTNVDLGKDLPSKFTMMNTDSEFVGVGTSKIQLIATPVTPDIEDKYVKVTEINIQADKQEETSSIILTNIISSDRIKHMIKQYQATKTKIDFIFVTLHKGLVLQDEQTYSIDYKTMEMKIFSMDIYNNYTITIYVDNTEMGKELQDMSTTDDTKKLRKDPINYEHI